MNTNYELFWILFATYSKTDVGEDWAFATKLTEFPENYEDDTNGNGFPDLDIFQVKFLGCTKINAAKNEEATANAIKNILSAAKGNCPLLLIIE